MKKKAVVKETEYEKNDDEEVVINEEVYSEQNHHSNVEGATWGVLFIFAGIVLLFNMFGLVSFEIWKILLQFWPVLIIIAGVQMIFGPSKFGKVLSSIITVVLLAWVILVSLHEVSPNFFEKLPEVFKKPIEWWEVLLK